MHPETDDASCEEPDPTKEDTPAPEAMTETEPANSDTKESKVTETGVSTPSVSFDDKAEQNSQEEEEEEEEKPVKFGKIVDPHVLGCCEFCGGPVKRRKFCSPLKRFCSKGCSRSSRKAKVMFPL